MSQSQQTELECKQCGERNPLRFEVCWNCGKSLEDAKHVESSETADENDKRQTWHDLYGLISKRRLEWCELLAVVLAACAYQILMSLFYERPAETEAPQASQLLSIPHYIGWVVLLWLLIRRDSAVKQPVPIVQCRWYLELLFAGLIVVAKFLLSFAVTSLAHDWGVPKVKPPIHVEVTHATQWALLAAIWFFTAMYEECLFRVYLQSKLESLLGEPILAILLSAMLFAVGHGYPPRYTLHVFAFGLLFGTVYHFSRRVPRLVLAHWWYNLLLQWLSQH